MRLDQRPDDVLYCSRSSDFLLLFERSLKIVSMNADLLCHKHNIDKSSIVLSSSNTFWFAKNNVSKRFYKSREIV